MLAAPVMPNAVNAIEFITEHEGPELLKGGILIVVRKHTKVVAPGIKVVLLRADDSPAAGGTTNGSGQVELLALEPGNYTLGYADAPLVALTVASGKNPTKTVYPLPPMGELEVTALRAGTPVGGTEVVAMNEQGPPRLAVRPTELGESC